MRLGLIGLGRIGAFHANTLVGIPAIDLIDFEYPHWHTVRDTPDKCSPASLKVRGGTSITGMFGKT